MNDKSLKLAIKKLEQALTSDVVDDLHFDAICKRFEVCFEYTWKHMKRIADEAGQEVYSPRDAIREAVKLKLISDLELWMTFLKERNLSVHNYYSGDPNETLKVIRQFVKSVKKLRLTR